MMYEIQAVKKGDRTRTACRLRGWYKSDRDMLKQMIKQGYRVVQWLKY